MIELSVFGWLVGIPVMYEVMGVCFPRDTVKQRVYAAIWPVALLVMWSIIFVESFVLHGKDG